MDPGFGRYVDGSATSPTLRGAGVTFAAEDRGCALPHLGPDLNMSSRGPSGRAVGSGDADLAALDRHLQLRQRLGGRTVDHRTVGDRELAAVAGAVDVLALDRRDHALLVGADRAERLEVALGRLSDHDL